MKKRSFSTRGRTSGNMHNVGVRDAWMVEDEQAKYWRQARKREADVTARFKRAQSSFSRMTLNIKPDRGLHSFTPVGNPGIRSSMDYS